MIKLINTWILAEKLLLHLVSICDGQKQKSAHKHMRYQNIWQGVTDLPVCSLEQASRCLQVPLMGMVRRIQLQIKRALSAWNGYGVNKQVPRFWAQHVNVFSVECRICHVRFTATLWSALTLIYRAWIEDLCVVLLARVSRGSQSHSSKAVSFFSLFFIYRWVALLTSRPDMPKQVRY